MSMELRMLLAIVLSFAVFAVYQFLFAKKPPKLEERPAETATVEPSYQEQSKKEEQVKALEETTAGVPVPAPAAERPGKAIQVITRYYVAELNETGGAFTSFKLKAYKESMADDAPMKELIQLPERFATPAVYFAQDAIPGLGTASFEADTDLERLDASEGQKVLAFTWTSPDGVSVEKRYTFSPDTYEIGLDVKVRNFSSRPIEERLVASLRTLFNPAKRGRYVFSGPATLIDGELHEIKVDEKKKDERKQGAVAWVADETQYFLSALVPEKVEKADVKVDVRPDEVLETAYLDPSGPVPPKTERSYKYRLYFGPKSLSALGQAGDQLPKALDFGFVLFDVIAKPLLYAMNFIHRFIPNYGVAIIIITIIVKLLFWPLSTKSYQSMTQMKRLQPKMAEIREKYKNDKKMMNQELMNLYRIYKVNPLGGCLPMLLQIPVFFALYKMLYQAIELRHAPFFLWINDLSAPDRLLSFDFKVPMMTPPYGIPVLTIIMGASMFMQQKMSPPPGDPAQAKMMMLMPIFFTFIFINFPSGLVLYWLVNNILSMAQQYYVTQKTA